MELPLLPRLSKLSLVIVIALTALLSRASAGDKTLPPGNYLLVYKGENGNTLMSTLPVTIKAEANSSLSISCEKAIAPAALFQKNNVVIFTLLFTDSFVDPASGGWVSSMTFSANLQFTPSEEDIHGVFADVRSFFLRGTSGSVERGEFLLHRLPESR